jgi:hypothetical protein
MFIKETNSRIYLTPNVPLNIGTHYNPKITYLNNEKFLASWVYQNSSLSNNNNYHIYSEIFNIHGDNIIQPFKITTNYLCSSAYNVYSVTNFNENLFIAAWNSITGKVTEGIYTRNIYNTIVQIFNNSGQKVGGEIILNDKASGPSLMQSATAIKALNDTHALAIWYSEDSSDSFAGNLYGKIISSTGESINNATLITENLDYSVIHKVDIITCCSNSKATVSWGSREGYYYKQYDYSLGVITDKTLIAPIFPVHLAQLSNEKAVAFWAYPTTTPRYGSENVAQIQYIDTVNGVLSGSVTDIFSPEASSPLFGYEQPFSIASLNNTKFVLIGINAYENLNNGIRIQLYDYQNNYLENDYNITTSRIYYDRSTSSYRSSNGINILSPSLVKIDESTFLGAWGVFEPKGPYSDNQFSQIQAQLFKIDGTSNFISSTAIGNTGNHLSSSASSETSESSTSNSIASSATNHDPSWSLEVLLPTLLGVIFVAEIN